MVNQIYLINLAKGTEFAPRENYSHILCVVQGSAKEWSLGCVKRAPAARGGQDAVLTKLRDHSLADPCTTQSIRL